MNKETCIFCFEEIEICKKIRKWKCNHTFHKECIDLWENNCPICRNDDLILPEIIFQISRNPSCPIWLQNISQYCHVINENNSHIYLNQWRDTDCFMHHHEITCIMNDTGFKKNIYAICKNCNSYQKLSE